MANSGELDLEAEGLVAYSYDDFFKIDKRIRKVQDIYLPTRTGISVPQIATFFLVLMLSFITQVLVVGPLFGVLGVREHILVFLAVVFGPPILCAWRVTRAMPHGKTIPGTVQSMARYFLDDELHRRGRPVRAPRQPREGFVQHYQRDWTVAQEYAAEIVGEEDWTDPVTEARFATGPAVNLQSWMDEKAIEHHATDQETKRQAKAKSAVTIHNPRGAVVTTVEA